ncbi:prolyl oligopeptidase family serine peptidase [Mesorhizobium sp. VK25A]|uniref:Prolyl oligopeptidase family serine peptidase n=1 Tax=Mesorhizobium vachelliae TaxID=3072309 RepID=A0ABU5A9P1_9HYPH|nr:MULTISPECIES: prolyl oligopeptidase family serine peptidase [unclassified Mesorhizobium]MDX8533920.1 prolyl oligopeptidase family serine peptidase [Mesorhizobium sp. VK25D]MDX8546609.1 prolyl oligopeptidase family serine peptidase [Mesorhizobium sp. VK25A]
MSRVRNSGSVVAPVAGRMSGDFRSAAEFAEAQGFYAALFGPDGHVFAARSLCGRASNDAMFFIGQSFEGGLDSAPVSRLYQVRRGDRSPQRLNDAETRQIGLSPDGQSLAVAYAGGEVGVDRIEIWSAGEGIAVADVPGRIELIDWSPDGQKLLLVVAGTGADLAGIHGGYAQKQKTDAPAWLPEVGWGEGEDLWRRIWLWDLKGQPTALTSVPVNVWEASWCGLDRIAAVTSDDHGEGSWYAAKQSLIDAKSGSATLLHTPRDQIGVPRGSPDGARIAFIQAFCSDRGLVAGQLSILDPASGEVAIIPTNAIDVTSIEWRSANSIHLSGIRGHETVVADYDFSSATLTELWSSTELTCGEWAPASVPVGARGSLFVGEAYDRAPILAEVVDGELREIVSLAASDALSTMSGLGKAEPFSWAAPDGLEIQGWLVRPPAATGPTPLLVDIHGGPISSHRNRWMARTRSAPLLVSRGWTIFFPNPRGSTGRGDAFARAVQGDMGGADADDILSGIDALVEKGLVDPDRAAITGTSYGGFMSAWLPTRSVRFAAAIPISPVGDWYSQHRTTQIPEFDALMLESSPWEEGGAYFARSPAFHRQRKSVPTLVMAGGIDKSTPPGQALECHFAALRSGSPSALATYPNAGHSLRGYPEYIDTAARIVWWLDTYVGGSSTATI